METKVWKEERTPTAPPPAMAAILKAPTILLIKRGSWKVRDEGVIVADAMVAG